MFRHEFIDSLKESIGTIRAESLIVALDTEPTVSIRINPLKITVPPFSDTTSVKMSQYGYFLPKRPSFTSDPLFHAGAYYVQEASSMALEEVLSLYCSQRVSETAEAKERGVKVLDLCAAPGGKSTHLLSLLKGFSNSFLVCNEVIRSRATILAENITKWGSANVVVTNNDPADFKVLPDYFDLVLVDAPCSGEGMFRKEVKAREEWSKENVLLSAARQRRIVADIWGSLKEGGLLIYSTCTFNRMENEENVDWIASEFGARLISTRRFYPGDEGAGEGFFIALLEKPLSGSRESNRVSDKKGKVQFQNHPCPTFVKEGNIVFSKGELVKVYPKGVYEEMLFVESKLRSIHSGVVVARRILPKGKGNEKGKGMKNEKGVLVPEGDLALSEVLERSAFHCIEISKEEALRYLSKEPLTFPTAPQGYILLTYKEIPLGFVKNLGSRSNNLWNSNWRIKKYETEHDSIN